MPVHQAHATPATACYAPGPVLGALPRPLVLLLPMHPSPPRCRSNRSSLTQEDLQTPGSSVGCPGQNPSAAPGGRAPGAHRHPAGFTRCVQGAGRRDLCEGSQPPRGPILAEPRPSRDLGWSLRGLPKCLPCTMHSAAARSLDGSHVCTRVLVEPH